jgi:hypothetical protein
VTQASLSPELSSTAALGALDGRPATSTGVGPAASLWLLALTSATLVFASLLLFGLLAQGAVGDGYVRGFATAVATLTGGLGLVAAGYVLVTAHRAGYLRAPETGPDSVEPVAATGLRVAPVVPAGLAYRKRQQRAAELAERRKQARAIDTAAAAKPALRGPAHTPAVTTPMRSAGPAPARPKVAPPPPVPTRPAVASARTAAPARPMAPARPAAVPPVRTHAPTRPTPRLATRPAVSAVSPAVLRLSPPTVRPRGQAALLQVGTASVRAPFVPRQPHPVLQRSVPRP